MARELDERDVVRAPILLLQMQIDPVPTIAKFNPWHKPQGPGGGQFASGPEAETSPADQGGIDPIAWDMHVDINSTYVPGIHGEDIDIAHNLVIALVQRAVLLVGQINFRPGMPDYGTELHRILNAEIKALHDPDLKSNPVYLLGSQVTTGTIPPGASVPDIVFGPPGHPLAVWELKTGSAATNLKDSAIVEQRKRTLLNMPEHPVYEYIQVYER